MPPTVDCIAPSIFRAASFTAASTRSCSISTSPDLIASGSIRRLSNCLRPSIFAVTVPPPDEASTTVSCIFFCKVSYCDLAFDINSCRLNPPIKPLLSPVGLELTSGSGKPNADFPTASPYNQSPYGFPRQIFPAAAGQLNPAPPGCGPLAQNPHCWLGQLHYLCLTMSQPRRNPSSAGPRGPASRWPTQPPNTCHRPSTPRPSHTG